MDVLGSSGFVLRNLFQTQNNLQTDVRALASGLRVQSAADDPSGLAISESLQSKVNGLNQSVQNVQTANNLMTVADGALSSIQQILQRIRGLIVESRSDINSDDQLSNIQTEINQLLLEVNRISNNTNFNGLKLLDGSLSQATSGYTGYGVNQTNQSVILNASGATGSSQVANADGAGHPGPLVTLGGPGSGPVTGVGDFTPALMIFQVIGYDPTNAVDPVTGPIGGPGVYVEFSAYSTSPSLGAAPLFTQINAVPVNAGPLTGLSEQTPGSFPGGPAGPGNPGSELLQNFTLANLTAADVGTVQVFQSTNGTPPTPPGAHPLQVNDGGQEGTTVSIALPGVSTLSLNISDLSVSRPETIDQFNNLTGQSSSNVISAADAELRTDNAIQTITTARADVGAQMVSLGSDANDDSTASVDLTASVSSIRDANIGTVTTDYTKNQILSSFGQQVLASTFTDAKQLTTILLTGLHTS